MSSQVDQDAARKLLQDVMSLEKEPQTVEWNRLVITAANAVITIRKNTFSAHDRKKLIDDIDIYLSKANHGEGIVHSIPIEREKPGDISGRHANHGAAEALATAFIANAEKARAFAGRVQALSGNNQNGLITTISTMTTISTVGISFTLR